MLYATLVPQSAFSPILVARWLGSAIVLLGCSLGFAWARGLEMSTLERVRELEERVECLQAIVDGSEAQTREAVVGAMALIVGHLARKGALTYSEIIKDLNEAVDPDYLAEDHNGRLLHELRMCIAFHQNVDAGLATASVPVSELLSSVERQALVGRARAELAFEAAGAQTKRKKRRKENQREKQVH